ncbi:MAG: hypothetical protein N2316_06935, partial [Spirochaetes bacterium]|nr:hypothetical protein [Spirochaetota bacterium]
DAQHIFYPLMVAVESVYHGAYRDRKVGYENIVFIHEPIGKLLNQNDVRFNFNANEIVCGDRARWNDFSMAASLKGGVFSLDKFTLTGYGAHYDVKSSAQFNLWMPQVSIEATMKDFDLKSFGADAGIKGEVGGVLNASMSFKINAYRLSQILENAILDVDINMIDGMMKNTPFQDALNDFAKKCGIKTPMFSEINGITASVLFNQRADNFSVSRIIFLSDKIRFTGRGRYDFFEGLNVPLEMQFTPTGEHASPSVLLGKIHGPLRKPYLFNTKKQQGKDAFTDATLVLFDIQ